MNSAAIHLYSCKLIHRTCTVRRKLVYVVGLFQLSPLNHESLIEIKWMDTVIRFTELLFSSGWKQSSLSVQNPALAGRSSSFDCWSVCMYICKKHCTIIYQPTQAKAEISSNWISKWSMYFKNLNFWMISKKSKCYLLKGVQNQELCVKCHKNK